MKKIFILIILYTLIFLLLISCKKIERENNDLLNNVNIKFELLNSTKSNNINKLEKLMKENPNISIDERYTENRDSLLIIAVKENHIKIVKFLISKDANIHLINDNGQTALYYAILNKNNNIIKILIENNADVERPINNIIDNNQVKQMKFLVKKTNILDDDLYNYSLYQAVNKDNLEILKILISDKYYLEKNTEVAKYLYKEASSNNNREMVTFLLNNGVNINDIFKIENLDKDLIDASFNGKLEIVKLVISKKANVNTKGYDDNTPLIIASRKGYIEIVDYLIKNGADINTINKYNRTSIIEATIRNHTQIVDLLINNDADLNFKDIYNKTAYDYAVEEKNNDIQNLLTKANAIIDNKDYDPNLNKKLLIAIENNNLNEVKLLINQGASVNLDLGDALNSPLILACYNSNVEIVRHLLKNGANPNIGHENGNAVTFTSGPNSLDIIKLLIDYGADNDTINYQGIYGDPLLYEAVDNQDYKLTEFLIKNGANVNIPGHYDRYILHNAIKKGYTKLIKLLINNGAKINQLDGEEKTPLDYAIENGDKDLISLLKKLNAKKSSELNH